MQRTGLLIVISGFSGVGKSTVIGNMFEAMPNLRFSVSCTSRKPRPGEKEGIDYYFVTEDEFEKKVANDEFWSIRALLPTVTVRLNAKWTDCLKTDTIFCSTSTVSVR